MGDGGSTVLSLRGFAVAAAETARMFGDLINTCLSCTPPLVQMAGIAAMSDDNDESRQSMAKFREKVEGPIDVGQFVFLKVSNSDSKPFSVAANENGLEILVRDVGPMTSKACQLKENDVVRVRGPYGRKFSLPEDRTVVFVGAGVGIAPIHYGAQIHRGPKRVFIGGRTADELAYHDSFRAMGDVSVSTDDGSAGHKGYIAELVDKAMGEEGLENPVFINCGPELAMRALDEVERKYAPPEDIWHVVERYTSCGIGICGKCSISTGERACVDGPVHSATVFTPGDWHRDETGKKIRYD